MMTARGHPANGLYSPAMRPPSPDAAAWGRVLAQVIDDSHLATGDQLSATVDDAVRPIGLRAEVMMVDLAQEVLTSLRAGSVTQTRVVGTMAGRAFQLGEILATTDEHGGGVLWVPVLDGTDRAGVLRVEHDAPVVDDTEFRRRLWSLAGLVGHVLMTKIVYSDRLRRWRSNGPLSPPSELLWQLLPPRTFATDRVVVSAILEPPAQVAGDAYDYNVDADVIDLAVFDSVGHDLRASMTTALAITAVRNARRDGVEDLSTIASRADELIAQQPGPLQFATAVLGRLDTTTGDLAYLIAGHPPPLLIRQGQVVKELSVPPRLPLGVRVAGAQPVVAGHEQLEPGDRLLLYSDGVTEARDSTGRFFGEERLIELTERAAAAELSAPETLRRLGAAVVEHQSGQLQDDATLLMVDWSDVAHLRMFPTMPGGPPAVSP
jgi:serine phosphatase RsbU (regulator of sigma subunit)